MEAKDLKLYEAIGKIQHSIASSQNYDDAVKSGLKIIISNLMADYAIVWYAINKEKTEFAPYYWIAPNDFTDCRCKNDDGSIVSKVITSSKPGLIEKDEKTQQLLGLTFDSAYCLPFNHPKKERFGCVEFIKKDGSFTSEERDVCQILTLLVETTINKISNTPEDYKQKKILLSCKDVKKSFKSGNVDVQVLKGVNFDVFEGEFLVLLGESGCGKSTMLNTIGGMLSADSGSIKFLDKEIIGLSQKELTTYRRENIGFIFQSYNLMSNLTAAQNLQLIGELVENPVPSIEALKLVGLEDKANNYPSQLSGGQQQRVSIARALVKKPKLILADEPTAALDFSTSIEVLKVFENILKKGETTLVMVTHNEEIAKMADRVIRFKNGYAYETTVNMVRAKADELEW